LFAVNTILFGFSAFRSYTTYTKKFKKNE
jgi:hypothetical protein